MIQYDLFKRTTIELKTFFRSWAVTLCLQFLLDLSEMFIWGCFVKKKCRQLSHAFFVTAKLSNKIVTIWPSVVCVPSCQLCAKFQMFAQIGIIFLSKQCGATAKLHLTTLILGWSGVKARHRSHIKQVRTMEFKTIIFQKGKKPNKQTYLELMLLHVQVLQLITGWEKAEEDESKRTFDNSS